MKRIVLSVAGLLAAHGVAAAGEPPRQALGKSVVTTWSALVTQRNPEGRLFRPQLDFDVTFYVSTAGRLFAKSSRRVQGTNLVQHNDLAPGGTQNRDGESTQIRFDGRRLVGTIAYASGAGQLTVSFGRDFRTCTIDVVFGKSGGPAERQGLDGRVYRMTEVEIFSRTCTVKDGNAIAGL
jgi:hypothetical protein